jgi:hypothetical protein
MTIQRLSRTALVLVTFCCGMRLWQYYVGLHLAIFDLLLLAFTILISFRSVCRKRIPIPMAAMRSPLRWLWAILALSAASFLVIDFHLAPASTTQFAKGIVDLAFHAVGLTAVVCFLTAEPPATSRLVLRAYIAGAVASSFYSFFEVGFAYMGYDLGKAIFGRLSIYSPDFDLTAPFYYEWDVFFRALGFTGVNSQATYAASVLPLLLLARPFDRRRTNLALAGICFAGVALTFSRDGVLSLALAVIFYLLIRPQSALRLVPRIAAICVPVALLLFAFSEGAQSMIATRLYDSIGDVGRGRREIYESCWKSIKERPFGHGINQFSVVVMNTDDVDLGAVSAVYYKWDDTRLRQAYANVHSNLLNWLFEGGWPMLAFQMFYYLSLMVTCWRLHTELSYAIMCSFMLLLVSGLFNMTLDLFSSELFFVIATAAAVRLAGKQSTISDSSAIGNIALRPDVAELSHCE